MRILHTEWSDGMGGQEIRILTEMIGMQKRGHDIMLATRPSCALGKRAGEAGIPVFHLPFAGKFDPATIFGVRRLVREQRVEIVNTHSGIDAWAGGIGARLAGAGLVRTRHLNLPLHRNWTNFVHYLPQRLVTCGQTMRQLLIDEHGFPPEEVVSIPTGIDFSVFQPRRERAEVRRELGIADDAWLLLMVAVIRGVKRHEVAIRAFAEFAPSCPRAVLVLCGEGPMRPDMEQLCRDCGVADKVRFLGHRSDVPDIMAAADALLLTSRSEGIPQTISQGMGIGLPVVATAVGGVPELVQDGRTGFLAPAEDVAAVAAAIGRLAADPALAAELGANGKRFAQERLSLDAMLDATERLYGAILAERHR